MDLTKTAFWIHAWESMGVEGWVYALSYAILYRGLDRPWILVSMGNLESPVDTGGGLQFWGSQVIYRCSTVWGKWWGGGIGAPNPSYSRVKLYAHHHIYTHMHLYSTYVYMHTCMHMHTHTSQMLRKAFQTITDGSLWRWVGIQRNEIQRLFFYSLIHYFCIFK